MDVRRTHFTNRERIAAQEVVHEFRRPFKDLPWLRRPDPAQPTSDNRPADEEDEFGGIRCPLCKWQPSKASRWFCDGTRSPEVPFKGCGTGWNTFETRGRCPGCSHQWIWTSCLRCSGWSLHEDWYETAGSDGRF